MVRYILELFQLIKVVIFNTKHNILVQKINRWILHILPKMHLNLFSSSAGGHFDFHW